MGHGLEPTETTGKAITVVTLGDHSRDRTDCSSYEAAIAAVKERLEPNVVVKIEARDEQIVFTSEEMSIDDWEVEWRQQKRQLAVDTPDHDCPYESVGCVYDDLCVQCKIDKVQQNV